MKKSKKIFLTSFLLAMIFILPIFVFAEYTFLEPLPGLDKTIETGKLSVYLTALFNYAIAVAAILAVIMIVIGGLQYIGAAGNTSVIEDAKDRIYWAVVGLFLALGSWMILFNINPELKELKLESVKTQTIEEKEKKGTTCYSFNNDKTECENDQRCEWLIRPGKAGVCESKFQSETAPGCDTYTTQENCEENQCKWISISGKGGKCDK